MSLAKMTYSDPQEALLQSACELLRHQWVKAFLFPTDRTTYVRQLHHALSQQQAITASVHYGTQSASVGPCQSLAGLEKKLSVLCVPSFSTGNITVGFEVAESLADSSPRPLGVDKFVGRYVRDDDEGFMVIVVEHPHLGLTEVTCATSLSAGCRSQVYAVMNLRRLREVLSRVHEKGYEQLDLRSATIFAYSSVDMRVCPFCGCNTVALCACRFRTKRKAHAMDHDAELQNFNTFTGAFEGLGYLKVVNNGMESLATFSSRVEARFTSNKESRRKLSRWAMTHAFEKETIRPGNYRMPEETLLIEDASDNATVGEESCTSRTAGRCAQREKRKLDLTRDLFVRRRFRRTDEGSVVSTASVADRSSALGDVLFTDSQILEHCSHCTPAQRSYTSVTGSQLQSTLGSDIGIELSTSVQRPVSSVKPPLPTAQRGPSQQQTCFEGGVIASSVPVSNPIQNVSVTQPQVLPQQVLPVQPMQQIPGMVLVPVRPVYQPILTQGVPLAPALTPMPAPRARDNRSKDEIRKARNRASAQRSNEKKKREVAQLKDDLEASVRKKEILKEREKVLRHENEALRAALKDTGVAV